MSASARGVIPVSSPLSLAQDTHQPHMVRAALVAAAAAVGKEVEQGASGTCWLLLLLMGFSNQWPEAPLVAMAADAAGVATTGGEAATCTAAKSLPVTQWCPGSLQLQLLPVTRPQAHAAAR
jgi:hypothetical protein